MVRALHRSIFGRNCGASFCSSRMQRTPRRPRSIARVKPTGPAPTIMTWVFTIPSASRAGCPRQRSSIDTTARESATWHGKKIANRLSAIGADYATGRITRLVASEENRRPRDVLARADAAHRYTLAAAFVDFRIGIHRFGTGCADKPRCDCVCPDAVRHPFHRLQLRKHDQSGFHHTVGASQVVGKKAGDRGDIDDVARFL